MDARQHFRQFDGLLFGAAVLLALFGVIGIYSVGGEAMCRSQLGRVAFGVVACFAAMYFDYRRLVDYAWLAYLGGIALLVAVIFVGTEVNGNQNWLSVAGFNFQPSELMKVIVILLAVRFLAERSERHLTRPQLFGIGVATALPVILILLQKDVGTALMFFPIVGAILLVAGIRVRLLAFIFLILLASAPLVWFGLKDYQRQRVLVTLDPELDPRGVGYQTRQSQIAIGSGGILGRGLGNGLQSQLGFVPESHTDFIFSLLTEETGFVGALFILFLYLVLLSRLVTLGQNAKDRIGMLLVAGVVGLIFSHVVINVGMALGILPPIGIPLPLLSYGGSSTLSTLAAIGLALNVGLRRYMYS